jgi:hypothetical protein
MEKFAVNHIRQSSSTFDAVAAAGIVGPISFPLCIIGAIDLQTSGTFSVVVALGFSSFCAGRQANVAIMEPSAIIACAAGSAADARHGIKVAATTLAIAGKRFIRMISPHDSIGVCGA